MSERIMTLFGEEIIPEQLKAVGKSRAKKAPQDKKQDTADETDGGAASPEAVATEEQPIAEVKPASKKKTLPTEKMELPEDWKGEKQYYSIGEVANLFKVKTSHIRFWTNEFKLKVRTTRKGDRLYTAEQVRELKAIYHLVKERGFTLNGAKAKMKAQNKRDVETVDLKHSLLQLRNKLLIIRNQLKAAARPDGAHGDKMGTDVVRTPLGTLISVMPEQPAAQPREGETQAPQKPAAE